MKKWAGLIISALVFGLLAGGVMVGINAAADSVMAEAGGPAQETQIEETEAAKEETAEVEDDSDREETAGTTDVSAVLDVSDIVEEAMPSVVSITNTMLITQRGYSSIFDYFYGGGQTYQYEVPASGSGIIVQQTDNALLIVTNNHVVEDSDSLSVTFIDGTTVDATINGTDAAIDIAVVSVPLEDIPEETLDAIKVAKLHTTDDLEVGQGVIAIGNALGYGQSVTVGYISALDREIQTDEGTNSGLIQVDAAINPGNSGGALLNMEGEVIGINEAKASGTNVEGMGYSIPVYKAMTVIENLSKEQIPEEDRGVMGVYVSTISDSASKMYNLPVGAMITGFSDEEMEGYEGYELVPSAAKEGGLQRSDVITAVEGQEVRSGDDLQSLLKFYAVGDTVTVTYQRLVNGEWEEQTAEVTLTRKASQTEASGAENGESEGGLGLPDNGLDNRDGKDATKAGPKDKTEKPEGPEAKPDEPKAEDAPAPEEEAPEGENGTGESEDGEGSVNDDLYDLFKEFLDQYGNN